MPKGYERLRTSRKSVTTSQTDLVLISLDREGTSPSLESPIASTDQSSKNSLSMFAPPHTIGLWALICPKITSGSVRLVSYTGTTDIGTTGRSRSIYQVLVLSLSSTSTTTTVAVRGRAAV